MQALLHNVSNDNTVTLGGKEYSLAQEKLKRWILFESLKSKTLKESKRGSIDGFSSRLCSCVSFILGIDVSELPWYEVAFAFSKILEINEPIREYSIFMPVEEQYQKEISRSWDYDDRIWYLWAHLLANTYGWTLEYIAELNIDDAIALMQEMAVQHQFEKEWEWSLSKIAYPYDEASKKYVFKPLSRPPWMQEEVKIQNRKVMIPKSMLPVGIVVRSDGTTTENIIN